MYSIDELYKKIPHANSEYEKLYLISNILVGSIIKNELNNCTTEEYFEGLIFSTDYVSNYFKKDEGLFPETIIGDFGSVMESLKYKTNRNYNKNLKEAMLLNIEKYAKEFNIENILSKNSLRTQNFLFIRSYRINSELSKLRKNENYMLPFLIYNMYVKPLNAEDSIDDNISHEEIIEKIGFEDLIKLSILFRVKYKSLIGISNKIFQTLL